MHEHKKVVHRLQPGTTFAFTNQELGLVKNLKDEGSGPAGQFPLLVILDLNQHVHPGGTPCGAIGIPHGAERHGF